MKKEHKKLYLNEVIVPSIKKKGFGSSFFVGKKLCNMAYMDTSELFNIFRRKNRNEI
jgi:hypothetical protein